MIGIGGPALLSETTGALHAFNIPLVSVVPPTTSSLRVPPGHGGHGRSSYSNMLTTAPDMAGQARVSVVKILKHTPKNIYLIIVTKLHFQNSYNIILLINVNKGTSEPGI